MVDINKTNDKELQDLQMRVDELNGKIKEYLDNIQINANRYRQCTS